MADAHTHSDDPVYTFAPAYDLVDEPQQIRIVFEGTSGYVPTAHIVSCLSVTLRLWGRMFSICSA